MKENSKQSLFINGVWIITYFILFAVGNFLNPIIFGYTNRNLLYLSILLPLGIAPIVYGSMLVNFGIPPIVAKQLRFYLTLFLVAISPIYFYGVFTLFLK